MTTFHIQVSEDPSMIGTWDHCADIEASDPQSALYLAALRWQTHGVQNDMSPPQQTTIKFVRLPCGAPGEWFAKVQSTWHDDIPDAAYFRAAEAQRGAR